MSLNHTRECYILNHKIRRYIADEIPNSFFGCSGDFSKEFLKKNLPNIHHHNSSKDRKFILVCRMDISQILIIYYYFISSNKLQGCVIFPEVPGNDF